MKTHQRKNILEKLRGLNFYVKSLLVIAPFSIALLIYLLSIGAPDLVFSDWFMMLASIPGFLAYQWSAAAYFGRLADLFKSFKRSFKKTFTKNKLEWLGTTLGVLLGIAVGAGLLIMNVPVPLESSLCAFAGVLFTLRQISVFGGLGNRVGRCADKDRKSVV